MSADPSSHAHSKSPDGTCASRVPQGPEGRPPNIAQPGRAGISIQRIERRRRGTDLFIATEAFPESGITSALRDNTAKAANWLSATRADPEQISSLRPNQNPHIP